MGDRWDSFQQSAFTLNKEATEHLRLLYMNSVALRIWKEMGMKPKEIGMRHRPTRTSDLAFGMPFSG
jgi:hypothetical protein